MNHITGREYSAKGLSRLMEEKRALMTNVRSDGSGGAKSSEDKSGSWVKTVLAPRFDFI